MGFLKAARTIIKVIGIVDAVIEQIEREKAADQAKKAAVGQKISEAYQKASNGPFHE